MLCYISLKEFYDSIVLHCLRFYVSLMPLERNHGIQSFHLTILGLMAGQMYMSTVG